MPNRNPAAVLPGLGGLSKLLRGLDANFRFTSVEHGRFRQVPVWKIEGGWQTARLIEMLPKQKDAIEHGKPPDLKRLPQYVPDRVVLLLGQENLFPYRIEYCRAAEKKDGSAEADDTQAIVTMDLYEVSFDAPIDPQRFFYNPGNMRSTDQTKSFIQSLGVTEEGI